VCLPSERGCDFLNTIVLDVVIYNNFIFHMFVRRKIAVEEKEEEF
jgi:hypothetical protein